MHILTLAKALEWKSINSFGLINHLETYNYVLPALDSQWNSELYALILEKCVMFQIGAFAAPDRIHWAPGLPKTRSGKIMRRILRKIASGQLDELGDTSTLADPNVVQQLIDLSNCWRRRHIAGKLYPQLHLFGIFAKKKTTLVWKNDKVLLTWLSLFHSPVHCRIQVQQTHILNMFGARKKYIYTLIIFIPKFLVMNKRAFFLFFSFFFSLIN